MTGGTERDEVLQCVHFQGFTIERITRGNVVNGWFAVKVTVRSLTNTTGVVISFKTLASLFGPVDPVLFC